VVQRPCYARLVAGDVMSRLRARVVPVASLGAAIIERMFTLFEEYYEEVAFEAFAADLSKKDDVILLVDGRGEVQGFSTMKNLTVEVGGRTVRGLFSGDTVVARAYWGQRVLGRAFLAYLFRKKARHPFAPYWWFLISKGFKTYLLMANNFEEYYPRPEGPTPPAEQAVLDAFASALYPGEYDPATGLISFDSSHGQVRRGVADITSELLENPKIAHFQRKNPTWFRGTELACIARMTWSMPLYYTAKAYAKAIAARPRKVMAPSPEAMAPMRVAGAAASGEKTP